MRSRLGSLVLSGILLVVAGGCSGDPKVAEIGSRFQQDAQRWGASDPAVW